MVCRLFIIKLVVFFLISKTNSHLFVNPFLSYFEKIVHMSVVYERMYLYGFASLYVRMFVAGANKVEGTMSSCVGTNEILASNH